MNHPAQPALPLTLAGTGQIWTPASFILAVFY
jgi:hypothetical protein